MRFNPYATHTDTFSRREREEHKRLLGFDLLEFVPSEWVRSFTSKEEAELAIKRRLSELESLGMDPSEEAIFIAREDDPFFNFGLIGMYVKKHSFRFFDDKKEELQTAFNMMMVREHGNLNK